MKTLVTQVIQENFSRHYSMHDVLLPSSIRQREFGFILPKERIMLRHRSFQNLEALKSFLVSTAPLDVYYSSAYYENPEANMDKKGWLGADLVFDIDADHISTPCGKVHDRWFCNNCHSIGEGPSPRNCPHCGEAKFETATWICDECLESAKREATKLLDMLMKDFGFSSNEIRVFFSGNRGYHVHVESESVNSLDSMARKEIVDYIIGLGFKISFHQLIDKEGRVIADPSVVGWKGRVATGLNSFLTRTEPNEISTLGLSKSVTGFLSKNREILLRNLKDNGWVGVKGVGVKNWEKIIQWIVSREASKVDTVVTTDVHRLIRLAGSLHGKTGFMKTEAALNGFEEFDPLKAAVAFKDGEIVVDIAEAPEFRIGDYRYGPYKNSSHKELPTAAALFLLCKGAAKVVE